MCKCVNDLRRINFVFIILVCARSIFRSCPSIIIAPMRRPAHSRFDRLEYHFVDRQPNVSCTNNPDQVRNRDPQTPPPLRNKWSNDEPKTSDMETCLYETNR